MDEITKKWEDILKYIIEEFEFSTIAINIWLSNIKVYSIEGNKLSLLIPKDHNPMKDYIIKKFSGVLSRIPVTFQFSLALLNDNKTIDFYKPEYVPLIYGTPLATMDVELEFFCTIAYEIDVYHCC